MQAGDEGIKEIQLSEKYLEYHVRKKIFKSPFANKSIF